MLTDKDKCDLFRYISDRMRDAESGCTRHQLVVNSVAAILGFIIDHPDVCAAELDDFFLRDDKTTLRDLDRLRQKGML